jgi:plasmid stabilization system protein ParE
VRAVLWTEQARSDLAAIRAFISQDSPYYASVVVAQLMAATDRLVSFPESGRAVPEFTNPAIREVVHRPYRIVYRLVGVDQIHILTVHHGSQRFPSGL